MPFLTVHHPSLDEIIENLSEYRIFARLGETFLRELARRMEWKYIPGGSVLFQQGDEGSSLFVLLGGRLRVTTQSNGVERSIGEIAQGEVVGELAVLSGGRRSARVVALRDSYLLELSKTGFDELVLKYPKLMMQVSRFIVRRVIRYIQDTNPTHSIHNFAVVGISKSVDVEAFTLRLVDALERLGSARLLNASRLAHELGGRWDDMSVNLAFNRFLGDWLNRQERKYQFLVYQCDANNLPWTGRALRQADSMLLVGHADDGPCDIPENIRQIEDVRNVGRRELVLLHSPREKQPQGTARWQAIHPGVDVHHIRWGHEDDFRRLARLVTGRAMGLVLGGGGARGYAHIGVIRAFLEKGIPIDHVGGCSMGALVAAQLAMGWDLEQITEANRSLFIKGRSLWDFTLPLISLTRGKRFEKAGYEMFGDIQIEDLWLNYFCVTSNLSRARQEVHRSGLLRRFIQASTALPGLLPPVYNCGEVLVDGGLKNNVPVDVMDDTNRGHICAVDVSPGKDATLLVPEDEPPSPWRLLFNRVNPWREKCPIPGMMNIMVRSATLTNITALERLKNHITLYFKPPMEQVSMLDWKALDRISELGYEYAMKQLESFDWKD